MGMEYSCFRGRAVLFRQESQSQELHNERNLSVEGSAIEGKGAALSAVTTKEKLSMTSGADTNIIGSQASGKKVDMKVGGNLNIESLQEKDD